MPKKLPFEDPIEIKKYQEFAYNFYEKSKSELKEAYKLVLKKYKTNQEGNYVSYAYPINIFKLTNKCIGYKDDKVKDTRSIDEKVSDFYFSNGYSDFVDNVANRVFVHCSLKIDISEFKPIPCSSNYDMCSNGTKFTIQKLFDKIRDNPEYDKINDVCKFSDYLVICTEKIKPIWELEVFRSLAFKIWSGDPHKTSLNPVELLLINKYVNSTRSYISYSPSMDKRIKTINLTDGICSVIGRSMLINPILNFTDLSHILFVICFSISGTN